jgi:hypothetical protein
MPKTRHRQPAVFISLVALGMFLYLGFLSVNYDLNGITEVRAIERGGSSLFPPSHMLYRPLVWSIYTVAQAAGYSGRSIVPAQVTTAVCGALGLGLFYWWVCGFIERPAIACAASLGFGTSWAYWVFSTDVFYITPAATVVLGALILLSTVLAAREVHPPSLVNLIGLGTLCALAVLLWQANAFFLPVPLVGLLTKYRVDKKSLFVAAVVFLVTASVVVGCAYFVVGALALRHWNVPGFLDWLLRYGAPLPIWGRWELARLPEAAKSLGASLVPVWEGFGLKALLEGEFQPDKLPSQMSLVALALMVLLPLLAQLKRQALSSSRVRLLGWTLLGCAAYLPFIVWWDPFEPKWFVIPNIGLWAILAVLWDSVAERFHHAVLFAGLILTISIANFYATIWPRHSEPNALLQRAECVAERMAEEDLFVTLEWEWSGYVEYFFDRQVFSMIDAAACCGGKEEALNLLRREIRLVHERGGRVYFVALDTYSPEHLDWLAAQTELRREDFQGFERAPAFVCDAVWFQELEEIGR